MSAPSAQSPAHFALAHIQALEAYTPGLQPTESGWIKLNTNELPYPCSPEVGPAVAAEFERLPLYPSPTSAPLRSAIAELHGLGAEQVLVGNGSDDVLNLLVRTFADREAAAAMAFPSYSLYPVLTAIQDARITQIPFGPDLGLPFEALCGCGARLLFLTTPNAPTGVGFALADLERLAASFDGLLVCDEAYADFAPENAVPLLRRHRHVVITRTLSKSYGLAGLRVGYALGDPEVIGLLDRVRDSYNVNRLSQAGALAAIRDQAYLKATVARVVATRGAFIARLDQRGWFTHPSCANFVFTRPVDGRGECGASVSQACYEFLRSRKVLVRRFGNHAFTAPFLRISIGTDAQMASLNETLDLWQKTTA